MFFLVTNDARPRASGDFPIHTTFENAKQPARPPSALAEPGVLKRLEFIAFFQGGGRIAVEKNAPVSMLDAQLTSPRELGDSKDTKMVFLGKG